jgi:hypothetical protein
LADFGEGIENKYFEKLIVDHECPMIKARKG